jgi:carbamoyl-phosphate synthase small subunit
MSKSSIEKKPKDASAVLVMADGSVLWGKGFGAKNKKAAEICFNTAMTGYQESLTDPSYAGQIITFTFPHIGNVGTNSEDYESIKPSVHGLIVRENITEPENWRSENHFNDWLIKHEIPGISGIDTRALTRSIRDNGAPNAILYHSPDGEFDIKMLQEEAANITGLEGSDLAIKVSCKKSYDWNKKGKFNVVAVDFGVKQNILRCLENSDCKVKVVPANTNAKDILAMKPDGIFLSNGPGDPAATGEYAIPMVKALLESGKPIFGICLGHQILALALGGKTRKMHLGHRGANHPVKDLKNGTVEITSQNHGFEVIEESLPNTIEITHKSLFDSSNEGLKIKDKPVFSVQYHPEASPGPQDSHYLFDRFVKNMETCGS